MAQRLTDLLALSHVPRWTIVDHLKPQMVSDHVYRVLVIATELGERLKVNLEKRTITAILVHDAAECRTGDVPTPAKKHLGSITNDVLFCPWMVREPEGMGGDQASIFLLSDLIEAATFIGRYGLGPHSVRVYMDLCRKIDGQCPDSRWREIVRGLKQEIGEDLGR